MTDAMDSTPDVRPWLQQGLVAAHAGDRDEARRCFQTAHEKDPDNTVALLWLAWLSPSRRESLALFCRVLELDPDNKRAKAGLEWARSRSEYGDDYAVRAPDTDSEREDVGTRSEAVAIAPPSHRPRTEATTPPQEADFRASRPPATQQVSPRGMSAGLQVLVRRVAGVLVTLSVIVLLTLFGLIVAERGQQRVPAEPLSAAGEALSRAVTYVTDHPTTYHWHREEVPAFELVANAFIRSAALLFLSLAIATLVGVLLGVAAAVSRRERGKSLVLSLSVLGISIPSFLLAMLIGVANIQIHRRLGVPALPPNGFGWDWHILMPALVLAARPLAQIVQITYVSMKDIMGQDYIRAAHAKGLRHRIVLSRHALRNALVPISTTLGTSLRLSLASLLVVEFFFLWPGIGLTLLQAIEVGNASLVTDLIVALGLLFLLVNLLLDLIHPRLDPRVGQADQIAKARAGQSWREHLGDLLDLLAAWWGNLRLKFPGSHRVDSAPEAPKLLSLAGTGDENGLAGDDALPTSRSSGRQLHSVFGNPMLAIGTLLVLAFFGLAMFGEQLTEANPYQTHGVMTIEGEIGVPPFPPSTVFPWGTDPLGRDLQALVFSGAKQTLALALFAVAARMLVGTVLGVSAGWGRGGRADRLVTGAVGVWAAFPVTLFAIIVILALGIQKGMIVFIVALCVVGWAEIAQFVRGQVIGIKPQLHIEAAQSLGTRTSQILTRHVLPLLLPSLLVLAVLEMAGVLLLLAELGFLNIFLGGGFKVQIGEAGRMVPVVAYYSDVPEWGALLANIRTWWRAYPWLAWYPGIFFFVAILAFNLWGEGLRRWVDQSRVNVSRLFSRYSLAAIAVLVFGLGWVLRTSAPLGVYSAQAKQFDTQQALIDVQTLTSPQFQGRETGTPGAKLAADYIAERMDEIGLQPGGQNDTYIQTFACPWRHLTELPRLEILGGHGDMGEALVYREDFAEYMGPVRSYGEGEGAIVAVAIGPDQGTSEVFYRLAGFDLDDKVILVREADMERINPSATAGVLLVSDDPAALQRKHLFPKDSRWTYGRGQAPVMIISEEVAERLLVTAGSSLAGLDDLGVGLQPGEVALMRADVSVHLATAVTQTDDANSEKCYNVIGFIPGAGARMESGSGRGLDSQVILVHAYYDGLGIGPDGTFYAGANDNASGVATILEMAHALNQGAYQPDKTVVFVAWSGGERGDTLSVRDIMNAKLGFSSLTVEAVIELSGVGAGDGNAIALGDASSFRLVQVFQKAARRMRVPTTTRGRGPHFGVYVRPDSRSQSALPLYVSWDGSDRLAHTAEDTFEALDPKKLEQAGQTTLLMLTVLSREVEY